MNEVNHFMIQVGWLMGKLDNIDFQKELKSKGWSDCQIELVQRKLTTACHLIFEINQENEGK